MNSKDKTGISFVVTTFIILFLILYTAISSTSRELPLLKYMPVRSNDLKYIKVKIKPMPGHMSIKKGESFYLIGPDGDDIKFTTKGGKYRNVMALCPLGKCTKQFVENNRDSSFLIGYIEPEPGGLYYIFDMIKYDSDINDQLFDINEANELFRR